MVEDARERLPRSIVGTLMVAAAAGLWGRFSVFFRNAEQIERAVALVIGLVFWNERPGLIALLGVLIVLGAAFRVLRQSSPVA